MGASPPVAVLPLCSTCSTFVSIQQAPWQEGTSGRMQAVACRLHLAWNACAWEGRTTHQAGSQNSQREKVFSISGGTRTSFRACESTGRGSSLSALIPIYCLHAQSNSCRCIFAVPLLAKVHAHPGDSLLGWVEAECCSYCRKHAHASCQPPESLTRGHQVVAVQSRLGVASAILPNATPGTWWRGLSNTATDRPGRGIRACRTSPNTILPISSLTARLALQGAAWAPLPGRGDHHLRLGVP